MKDVKFLRILKVRGSVLKVRGSVLKSIPRFGRFEVRFPEVREVRGSEFSGSTQHYFRLQNLGMGQVRVPFLRFESGYGIKTVG